MRFSSKRGRPKKFKCINNENKIDHGTEELQKKRLQGLTKEALDICFDKGIISLEQHQAALRFRWLYTLKFGAPTVAAVDWAKTYGYETRSNDAFWRKAREQEYAMCIEKLRLSGCLKIVLNIAVFNYFPRFLTGLTSWKTSQLVQNERDISKLLQGLDFLAELQHLQKTSNFNKILNSRC